MLQRFKTYQTKNIVLTCSCGSILNLALASITSANKNALRYSEDKKNNKRFALQLYRFSSSGFFLKRDKMNFDVTD